MTAAETANTGSDLSFSSQAQQPGHGDDEERLQEFRRLQLADADVDPARRAVHLGAEQRDEDQQDEEEGRAERATGAWRARGVIIEMTIITGTPTAIHAIWR